MDTKKLPVFTFIDDDGRESTLDLKTHGRKINGIAELIKKSTPPNSCVGLLYRSNQELVTNWFACLVANVRPLIMQYPTRKQSREYWVNSVKNTIEVAEVACIIADDYCSSLGIEEFCKVIGQQEVEKAPLGTSTKISIDEFCIIQLSSGTTGFRKAIAFQSAALSRHVKDFNSTLKLGPRDKIVSWLPLYHDMGFIACFVMPFVLGVDVVMLDPMTWIRKPGLLYDAIEKHGGTCCYMPNFGFEVMARLGQRKLPTMRWWISCSEPVSAQTTQKFLDATQTSAECFAACYAMAENIFAVTFRSGLKTELIDGTNVVSCGRAIAGVDLKLVDNEIWVRSLTSLQSYLGGTDIRDKEGYYATGDLGEITAGELYVTGRKQDLLIQAGRKFMLSDIDILVNELHPDIKGRAAAIQIYDERVGTQKPIVLIESKEFIDRRNDVGIADEIKSALGLDQIEVAYVPPKFLTKTSSGKFNRKISGQNWLAMQRASGAKREVNPVEELRQSFSGVSWDRPVEDVLDSLSLTVLRIVLSNSNVTYDGRMTLQEFCEKLQVVESPAAEAAEEEVIRIVSLADAGRTTRNLTEKHVARLAEAFGCPVALEHVCLPPSPVLLSDLVFYDYFRPRMEDAGQFTAMAHAFAKLRSASLILVDDVAEMFFPPRQVYGAMSHNIERDPRADLVAIRWPRYGQLHHRLPLTIVAGRDLPFEDRSAIISSLGRYLDTPIYRIALIEGYGKYTDNWEYRSLSDVVHSRTIAVDTDHLIESIVEWAGKQNKPLRRFPSRGGSKIDMSDAHHFCSHYTDPAQIDQLVGSFNKFCISGQKASVPYVWKKIESLGKSYFHVPSHAPEIIDGKSDSFDCLLICGSMGKYTVNVPAAAIMKSSDPWRVANISEPDLAALTFVVRKPKLPVSADDWFYPYEIVPKANEKESSEVRRANRAYRQRAREQRLGRRARRKERNRKRA